jgi:hypothetical protein
MDTLKDFYHSPHDKKEDSKAKKKELKGRDELH